MTAEAFLSEGGKLATELDAKWSDSLSPKKPVLEHHICLNFTASDSFSSDSDVYTLIIRNTSPYIYRPLLYVSETETLAHLDVNISAYSDFAIKPTAFRDDDYGGADRLAYKIYVGESQIVGSSWISFNPISGRLLVTPRLDLPSALLNCEFTSTGDAVSDFAGSLIKRVFCHKQVIIEASDGI